MFMWHLSFFCIWLRTVGRCCPCIGSEHLQNFRKSAHMWSSMSRTRRYLTNSDPHRLTQTQTQKQVKIIQQLEKTTTAMSKNCKSLYQSQEHNPLSYISLNPHGRNPPSGNNVAQDSLHKLGKGLRNEKKFLYSPWYHYPLEKKWQ